MTVDLEAMFGLDNIGTALMPPEVEITPHQAAMAVLIHEAAWQDWDHRKTDDRPDMFEILDVIAMELRAGPEVTITAFRRAVALSNSAYKDAELTRRMNAFVEEPLGNMDLAAVAAGATLIEPEIEDGYATDTFDPAELHLLLGRQK